MKRTNEQIADAICERLKEITERYGDFDEWLADARKVILDELNSD